jgi:hypothetical protein
MQIMSIPERPRRSPNLCMPQAHVGQKSLGTAHKLDKTVHQTPDVVQYMLPEID